MYNGRRDRPGIGPYSRGLFYREKARRFSEPVPVPTEGTPPEGSYYQGRRDRPGIGPYSRGLFFREGMRRYTPAVTVVGVTNIPSLTGAGAAVRTGALVGDGTPLLISLTSLGAGYTADISTSYGIPSLLKLTSYGTGYSTSPPSDEYISLFHHLR